MYFTCDFSYGFKQRKNYLLKFLFKSADYQQSKCVPILISNLFLGWVVLGFLFEYLREIYG